MTSVLSIGSGCGAIGGGAAFILNSLTLNGSQATVYQKSAMPVAFLVIVALVLSIVMSLALARKNLTISSPQVPIAPVIALPSASATEVTPACPPKAYVDKHSQLVFNALVYSFGHAFSFSATQAASSMIYQVEYNLNENEICCILASTCALVAALQLGLANMLHLVDETTAMLTSAIVFCLGGLLFFNFGPWLALSIAVLLVSSCMSCAAGIVNGIVVKATIPGTNITPNVFSARRTTLSALGKLSSGPMSRGIVAAAGQNGFAIVQLFLLIGCIVCIVMVCLHQVDIVKSPHYQNLCKKKVKDVMGNESQAKGTLASSRSIESQHEAPPGVVLACRSAEAAYDTEARKIQPGVVPAYRSDGQWAMRVARPVSSNMSCT